jgi:hypothetical protein
MFYFFEAGLYTIDVRCIPKEKVGRKSYVVHYEV